MPPAVARAVDRAVGDRTAGALLLNTHGTRMDRYAATRRLHGLQKIAGVRIARMHPHMAALPSVSEDAGGSAEYCWGRPPSAHAR